MRIERDAERTADQPAAQKDDICLLHRRDVDRPVAASNPLIDPADRRTRPTARLLDVGLASGDNRNIGCTAAHRRRFGGRIMASRAQPSLWRESVKGGAARSGALFAAIGIALVTLAIPPALAPYNAGDAALNTAAGGPTRNLLGG